MEIWQELAKSEVFYSIDEQSIKALNFCFKSRLRFIEKNEIIVNAGDSNDYCIFVLNGKLKSVNYDYFGAESIITTYSKGEIFGLNEAYTNSETYQNSLVATEKSTIILFNRYRFIKPCENNCHRHKQLLKNITNLIVKSNLEMIEKINILQKRTIREKVLAYLHNVSKKEDSKYFDIPFNRQELANYLAIDRSALSIELAKMKKDGLIDFNKNHFNLK